jgi:hypothetical protein
MRSDTTQQHWFGLVKSTGSINSPTYWLDGSNYTYRNWETGAPNEVFQCIRINVCGCYNDRICSDRLGYVCKTTAGEYRRNWETPFTIFLAHNPCSNDNRRLQHFSCKGRTVSVKSCIPSINTEITCAIISVVFWSSLNSEFHTACTSTLSRLQTTVNVRRLKDQLL